MKLYKHVAKTGAAAIIIVSVTRHRCEDLASDVGPGCRLVTRNILHTFPIVTSNIY